MQREKLKKQKAEEKRKRRLERKSGDGIAVPDTNCSDNNGLEPIQVAEQPAVENETADDSAIPDDK